MRGADTPKAKPGGVEDAQAQLDRAENDLNDALVMSDEEKPDARTEPGHEQSGVEPPAPYAERPTKTPQERRCTTACRALTSMTRATERLCELAGDDDQRCGGAKTRLAAARDLVHKSCPSCS